MNESNIIKQNLKSSNQENAKNQSSKMPNRKDRRTSMKSMGYFKTNKFKTFEMFANKVLKNIENGKRIHSNNEAIWNDITMEKQYELEERIRKSFKEAGIRTDKEIDLYLEKWYDRKN